MSQPVDSAVEKDPRFLPTNVTPVRYYLRLEPNILENTFNGCVAIDLDINNDTSSIVLHALDLDVQDAAVLVDGKNYVRCPSVQYDRAGERITISFEESLRAGFQAQLMCTFSGTLSAAQRGFYRTKYEGEDGGERWIASTQMQPNSCRRAFPCFDQPELKARFNVTLIVEPHLTCLGNMDIASEEPAAQGSSMKAVTFRETPLMSTYLVSFAVGDRLHRIITHDFRVPIHIYTASAKDAEVATFSLDLASKTMNLFERTLQCQYPLPKIDILSVPNFQAGAMENWGLLMFRTSALLFDKRTDGLAQKQQVVEVVIHELAHQWFSCLVTTKSWDATWLNEGFATWMSMFGIERFYPDWKVWPRFVATELQAALILDSLRSSHPIEFRVEPGQEGEVFDAISYQKGSSVIRAISDYLGEDIFLAGVQIYLERYAFGTTHTDDLWRALQEASGLNIKKLMDIWVLEQGYPVLTVTEDPKADKISVTQNRFLGTADVQPEDDKVLYPVPLNVRTKAGLSKVILKGRSCTFDMSPDFYKINSDQIGLYRTLYPPNRLQKLAVTAKDGFLSIEDRIGIIADTGALISAGHGSSSTLLSLVKEFEFEDEYLTWRTMTAQLDSLRAAWLFEPQETQTALDTFQQALIGKILVKMGWNFDNGVTLNEEQLKSLLFDYAGKSGDKKVIEAASAMFASYFNGNKNAVHPNLLESVFAIVLRKGGVKEYDMVFHQYLTTMDANEKNTALKSLGQTTNPALLSRSLELVLGDQVSVADLHTALSHFSTHVEGTKAVWGWLKNNWMAIIKKLPPGGLSLLAHINQRITIGLATVEQLNDVEQFFADKSAYVSHRILQEIKDRIRVKSQWTARDRGDVIDWLRRHGFFHEVAKDSLIDVEALDQIHVQLHLQR